ncbi:hypothetical protein LOK49_LG13G02962 [Camellia lanceoleosa]|uniref:Uncharacterized protein n=1 Tax=Camellia lanceoleosa TaxID=1840588 RepID=A0ACC0FI71_9ERIC|nr:hypothetical protein LOK49_LG13G02962 [Camellia lanceoleosa]
MLLMKDTRRIYVPQLLAETDLIGSHIIKRDQIQELKICPIVLTGGMKRGINILVEAPNNVKVRGSVAVILQTKKEKDYGGKRVESDIEPTQKHHSHSGSGLEPCSSVDQKKQYKDKDPSHISRHSRRNTKPSSDDMCNNSVRWRGLEEDYGEGYRYIAEKEFTKTRCACC